MLQFVVRFFNIRTTALRTNSSVFSFPVIGRENCPDHHRLGKLLLLSFSFNTYVYLYNHRHANELTRMYVRDFLTLSLSKLIADLTLFLIRSNANNHVQFYDCQGRMCERLVVSDVLKRVYASVRKSFI